MMSHTSGLPFQSALEEPTLDRYPLRARVRSYAMTPLDFEPDSKYQYSNAGINTAARIIEVVTGKPFEKFLDERLFQPLGMLDTTFWPSEKQAERIAKSYKPGFGNKGLEETTIGQHIYGFGFGVGNTFFGHGGAYATNSSADTERGLIFVWLVQHAGFPDEGSKAQDAFKTAAIDAFPPGKK